MSGFRFQIVDVRDCSPQEWLRIWADKYQPNDDLEYRKLIANYTSFTAQDFERIGKWKDGATTERRWRSNVASVAYRIWRQAAEELPKTPEKNEVAAFLKNWSRRTYTDVYKNGPVEKHFGLSRATTLLHFISGGEFPIFDSRVRTAIGRLLGHQVPVQPDNVLWYLDSYCRLFSELAALCEVEDTRLLDKALFSYGASKEFYFQIDPTSPAHSE